MTAVEKTPYGLAATLVLGELDDMMAARQARMASGDDAEARNLGMRINEAMQIRIARDWPSTRLTLQSGSAFE